MDSTSNASPNLRTILVWLDALSIWDIKRISTLLSDNYQHRIIPESLNERALMKEEWLESARGSKSVFEGFKLDVMDFVESENKVWLHAKADTVTISGTPYKNEYILMFTLHPSSDPEMPKIQKIVEFVDSQFTVKFAAGMALELEENTD